MHEIFNQVKADYRKQPYVTVDFPAGIDTATWEFFEDSISIPPLQGNIYCIFAEDKKLLYIGKTKDLALALRNHLIRKTSKSASSLLETIKEKVSESEHKRIYLKVIDIEPVELASAIKPLLVKMYAPSLVKRIS